MSPLAFAWVACAGIRVTHAYYAIAANVNLQVARVFRINGEGIHYNLCEVATGFDAQIIEYDSCTAAGIGDADGVRAAFFTGTGFPCPAGAFGRVYALDVPGRAAIV